MAVDSGAGAIMVDSAVVGVVDVSVEMAVLDDEGQEVTEVGVVLGVPLDEQLDIAMANAVDNIAVTHRRMALRRRTRLSARGPRHCRTHPAQVVDSRIIRHSVPT